MSTILKNTVWIAAGEVMGRILRIILVVYAARVLGAAEWGIASYVLSWAALFTIATDMGLGAILTRYLIRDHENSARWLSAVFLVKCSLLLVNGLVIVTVVPQMGTLPLSPTIITLLFGLVFFDSLRLIPSAVNKARETMHYETAISTITQGSILIIGLSIISRAPSAEGLTLAYVLGSAIGTACAAFTITTYLPQFFTQCNARIAWKLLRDAWPIAIIGLLGSIMLNTDIIMISWFKGAEDIGYYSAAQKIIFTLYVIPTLIGSAAFPAFTRAAAHTMHAFKKIFIRTLRNVLMIGAFLAGAGIIAAPHIITIVYGAHYLPAVPSFIILLITLPCTYAAQIITNAAVVHNAQKKFIRYALIGIVSNILFNILFIPLWGITGAALATLLAQAISLLFIKKKIQEIIMV